MEGAAHSDCKSLGMTEYISRLMTGLWKAKGLNIFIGELLLLPIWSQCVRQGRLRIGPDWWFAIAIWVCVIGMFVLSVFSSNFVFFRSIGKRQVMVLEHIA